MKNKYSGLSTEEQLNRYKKENKTLLNSRSIELTPDVKTLTLKTSFLV